MVVRLKKLWAEGKLTKIYGLGQLISSKFIEIIGIQGGYDGVWLDNEHAGISIEQIEQATLAARACGLDSFVRLAATDYGAVMRPLEAGAGGIMAAQVRNSKQTEQIVQWAKFHPTGLRGLNSLGVDGDYGWLPAKEYTARVNAETFVAIQIEHFEAVEDVEKIAAVPNVDLLFVGPSDLSQSMGITGEMDHPRLWGAIERVAQAAKTHNVPWAIVPASAAAARRCVDLGCRCLAIGFDTLTVHVGLRTTKGQYAEFF